MKHFALNLTAISPLAIRADRAPGGAANARYIAGSTLMGSLATLYRLSHADRATEFEELFLKERIHYPNLYPANFQNPHMQDALLQPVYQAPKTAQTCKRFDGFKFIGENDTYDDRHGVRDSLFDWAIFKLASAAVPQRSPADLLKLLHDQKNCPTCKRPMPMKPFTDFYRRGTAWNQPMLSATAPMRVQTHTGINRTTGTVQEGILYSRQVFEEDTRFWGMASVPEDLVEPFTAFLVEVGETGLIRVGTGRTRGLGKVHLSAHALADELHSFAAFKQRLETFHARFCARANEKNPGSQLAPFYFALTLCAPAILRDELLRYQTGIDERLLAELSGLPADSFQAIYQAASTRRVTGWNELWGLPRAGEYAIDTGSVFFFAARIEQNEDLLQKLFKLEQEGIGQRRAEGFGHVCVSDPFHLEVNLR